MTALTANVFGVVVPARSYEHHLYNYGTSLCYWDTDCYQYVHFDGKFTIIGLAKDLKESDWEGIVGWFELAGKKGYRDYSFDDLRFPFATSTLSGLSLLASLKLDPETTLIISKQ